MEINAATTTANQAIGTNKAQTGLDVLTRTVENEKTESSQEPHEESLRLDVAKQTGKGQHIDVKA